MSNIEKIRQEIKRLYDGEAPKHNQQCEFEDGYFTGIATISKFIDSLPDENNPEPYSPVYDEDYLNGKIAKAKKSWEGVDVDKFMNEVRGRDEEPSKDLEKEIFDYWSVMEWAKVMTLNRFKVVARYFYGLGLNHQSDECLADKRKTSDEPVTDSHDLEEEIQNTIDKYPLNKEDMSEDDIATYHQGLIFGARHFAEWGRKQVLQEIYDGKIHPVDSITAAWL